MANNAIDEFGCFTLMAGLRENQSLRNIVLDGNPLGVQVKLLLPVLLCSFGVLILHIYFILKCKHTVFFNYLPMVPYR